jgi:hypothetical protein
MIKLTSMSMLKMVGGCGLDSSSSDGDQWPALVNTVMNVRVLQTPCHLVTASQGLHSMQGTRYRWYAPYKTIVPMYHNKRFHKSEVDNPNIYKKKPQ